ncbi:hypothetical protein MOQ_002597 [Trypanosoma cruzi marinkellei]|uniref:Uncharacterized protein n=1 Tax=Trypanosoma cruzi marinkellei TaxID=85056 RepID=K2N6E6_TRYCR|nr:hypothetical protein MOQ_002597 [Trypanosoma cruzi marinkellei]
MGKWLYKWRFCILLNGFTCFCCLDFSINGFLSLLFFFVFLLLLLLLGCCFSRYTREPKSSVIEGRRRSMQGGKVASLARSSGDAETGVSTVEFASVPMIDRSLSRAAAFFPASVASSCVAENETTAAGVNDSALHDTTVFSDLSDEIQRVEARLSAIREEEARLMPKRAVPAVPVRESGRFSSALNLKTMDYAAELTASGSCRLNSLSNADTLSTEPDATFGGKSFPTGAATSISSSGRERSPLHRIDASLAYANDLTNTVSERRHYDPLESAPSSIGCMRDSRVESVRPLVEPRDAVYSLVTFLRPLRVVEIEIDTGVYEKLEIFAGEDMEEVARRFITKHGLNMERAFKPLYAFLSSLKITEVRNPSLKSSKEKVSPPQGSKSSTATVPSHISHFRSKGDSGGVKPSCTETPGHSSEAQKKIAACEKPPGPHTVHSIRQHPTRSVSLDKTRRVTAANGTSQFVKQASDCIVREEKAATSGRSQKKNTFPQHQAYRTGTPVNGLKSPQAVCQMNKIKECRRGNTPTRRNVEDTNAAPTIPVKNTTPPEVVAVEVEVNRPTITRTNSTVRVRSQNGVCNNFSSRQNSSEQCRGLGTARNRKPSTLEEEPVPTFRPSLAPRSKELVAKNPERLQGPTYARLHAHNRRFSKAFTKANAECTGKPKILPRKRENNSQVPVGQRLYDQAVDQRHRMQERQMKEQQRKDDEERFAITGPQINKFRGRSAKERDLQPSTYCALRARPLNHSRQNSGVLKSHEERELEACTFVPAVNPASVRIFNMVVRGRDSEEEWGECEGNSQAHSVDPLPSGGSRSQNSENVRRKSSVADRLLRHEQNRRKRLEEERLFRETFDLATGRPLFRPFLGR